MVPRSRPSPSILFLLGCLLCIVESALACRASAPRAELSVLRREFLAGRKVVAVLALDILGRKVSERAAREVEGQIEERLAAAGLGVVPAAEFRALWERHAAKESGFFDPRSGQLDETRFGEVQERCVGELARARRFDYLLIPALETVRAPFWGEYARWDGATERVVSGGELDAHAEDYEGSVPALSLRVEILARGRGRVYAHQAGLQVLARLEAGEFVSVAAPDRLGNPEQNREAVRLALAAVLEN